MLAKNCKPGDGIVSFSCWQRTDLVECVSAVFHTGLIVSVHRVGEHCQGEGGDEQELHGESMLESFRISRSGDASEDWALLKEFVDLERSC